MLESMIENPRPTRAEVSDVANAVYDGTDAVMLSGESAVGKYPVETVSMMARIVVDAERHIKEAEYTDRRKQRRTHLSVAETICEATAHASEDLDLRAIALFTETGETARQLSKYHPAAPIFAFSPVENTVNRLNLLPKRWSTWPRACLWMAVSSAPARSSPSWPAPAPSPAPPTSCACTWWAINWRGRAH
jgi:pyruvate kinase